MTEHSRTTSVRPGAEDPAHGSTRTSTATPARPGAGPEDRPGTAVRAGRRAPERAPCGG